MAEKTNMIERAIALNAFTVLCPREVRMAQMPAIITEIEDLGEAGMDRFEILTVMLEKRGIANDTRVSWRYMSCLERRHAEARARVDKLAPRTKDNAIQFDEASTTEIALNNAIQAAFEDAEMRLESVLVGAGLGYDEAEALLSLAPSERVRYEESDTERDAYRKLISNGLALDISSEFSGASRGIRLSAAGEIVWRLVTGRRKIGK